MRRQFFDKKLEARQSVKQLEKRGLMQPGLDLATLGIVELITDQHGFDTDIYVPVDTGETEVREDGKAYVVYEKKNRASNEETGLDIRRALKDKVHSRRDSILVSGLNFSFDGETHVLQTRDAVELVNWSSVYTKALALPADTTIKVRTEADKSLFIPASRMVILLDHMIISRTAIMDASWAIKDSIDQATTESDAFAAYESGIDTVWPDDSPIQL